VHLYGQFDPVTGRRIRSRLNKDAHRLLDTDNKQTNGGAGRDGARGLLDADKRARAGGGKRSLQQCMADAFENMTAGIAGGGKPYADIALVARLDPATEKLMASTGDGEPLPAGVIERLAGESSWFGLVLSAKGVPMWKGRNVRRVTESQFQALMALYGGCAGCGEPDEGKVHAHHMDPFAWGGRTDLDNLLPLCWGCHARIHDHGWQVVAAGDGKHTIRPPDRIHHGPARQPDTAPLFVPPGPDHGNAPDPPGRIEAESGAASLFAPANPSHGCDVESGASPLVVPAEPDHSTTPEPPYSIEAESGAASLFTSAEPSHGAEPEPQVAPGSDDACNGKFSNGSRAGPTGPQAARDALRRASGASLQVSGACG